MRFVWVLVLVAGCGAEREVAGQREALGTEPGWVVTTLDARDGRRLVAGAEVRGAEGTDHRPSRRMAVLDANGVTEAPEGAVAGALTERGVVWVTTGGDLLANGRVLDRDVIAEIDVDATGRFVAYAKRPGDDAGVFVADLETQAPARRVTPGMQIADRPLFVDDHTMVVVGSMPSGIAGVWLVQWRDGSQPPRNVTNGALRVGTPFGDAFVPPPAYHESMRVEGSELVYHDGVGERRVALQVQR